MAAARSRKPKRPAHPFRRAVLRGLGVAMPPLLTILFFFWVWNSIQSNVITPITVLSRNLIVSYVSRVHDEIPLEVPASRIQRNEEGMVVAFVDQGTTYRQLSSGQWIPKDVADRVRRDPGHQNPDTAAAAYQRYVEIEYLRPVVVVPMFFIAFFFVVYLLGRIIAARVGRLLWTSFERLINHLPLIRSVYGTVKQVTDIVFSEQEIEYTRVVAVEYPRRGVWSVGFVTGESMASLWSAAKEPVLSVLMPTSPMPATGFTISVRKSETVDLDLSVDQAFQFVVSCGVVVPEPEKVTSQDQADVELRVQQAISASQAAHPAAASLMGPPGLSDQNPGTSITNDPGP